MRFTVIIEGDLSLKALTDSIDSAIGRMLTAMHTRGAPAVVSAVTHDGKNVGTLTYLAQTPTSLQVVQEYLALAQTTLQNQANAEAQSGSISGLEESGRLMALVEHIENIRRKVPQ